MFNVLEINDIGELERYRLPWRMLHAQTRRATFFQTLDWLQLYWESFGAGQKLRACLVYHANELTGIAPFVVRRENTKIGEVRVLTYPLQDWGSYFGPIGSSPTSTLYEVFRHFRDTDCDWDLIEPRWIDREMVDFGRTSAAMKEADFRPVESTWKEVALVEFGVNWEEYWQARSPKFKENIRRTERRLKSEGELEFVRHRPLGKFHDDEDPRWDLYDHCVQVAAKGWQGDAEEGTTLNHEQAAPFFRAAHELAAIHGMLDMTLLYLRGKPVAFTYNYHHAGYVTGIRMGFDAEYRDLGVGRYLQYLSLKDSACLGDHTLDLGPDYADAKRPWMTRMATSSRCSHYTLLSPKAQLLGWKRWWSQRSQTYTPVRRFAGKTKSTSVLSPGVLSPGA